MVLEKQVVHKSKQIGKAFTQMTLDDDYNLPDYKPDLARVIRERGQLQFEEFHVNNGHILVRGMLKFHILYRTDLDGRKINYLKGEIPFQESLSMEGVLETDNISLHGKIEDISVGIINSRKLGIRSLAEIKAVAERAEDVQLFVGSPKDCEVEHTKQKFLELVSRKKDTMRIHQELTISSNKPNIEEIIWSSVELRGVENRMQEEHMTIQAEAFIQVLYQGAEDEERLQWFEATIPIKGSLVCENAGEKSVHHMGVQLEEARLDIIPDEDGEARNLGLDMLFQLQISLWREEQVEMISDIYALDREICMQSVPTIFENLWIKNESKCKVVERIELDTDMEDAVQICMQETELSIEQYSITPEGLLVEGILTADILYMTSDEAMPLNAKRAYLTFSQVLEMPQTDAPVRLYLECSPEQITTVLSDARTIEVRGAINVCLLALAEEEQDIIMEVTEKELDIKALQRRPGLTGYIVREGESLFSIAKTYHTTVQNIMKTNELSDSAIHRGEKLLIVKEV